MMQKRFAQTINEMRGLISRWSALSFHADNREETKILLAVSGGIDSICMASLFASLQPACPFAIAHCNFRLRGEESDGDESFVTEWAERHGVVIHKTSFDTESYAKENGISIEMAARELRYKWFAGLCSENGYIATAVAHNANDNAETLILNLLRGSGMRGISGMSQVSDHPYAEGSGLKLIRPLLGFTRKQIEGYVFSSREEFREDSSNASSEYKRNLIRNEVFPLFARINPSFVSTLNREMGYFAEASDIVDNWCQEEMPDMEKGSVIISISELLNKRHWKYLLYHMLEPYGFHSATLSSLEDLLSSDRTSSGKRFESASHTLLVERDSLRVVPSSGMDSLRVRDEAVCSGISAVRAPGTYHFNNRVVKVEMLDKTEDMAFRQPSGVLVFDAGKLRFPFVLRAWKQGDWMVPFGMKGRKKVSDIFTDLKYDTFMKSSAVILVDTMTEGLADDRHIAAVVGVRMDDRYKVTSSTDRIIRISII